MLGTANDGSLDIPVPGPVGRQEAGKVWGQVCRAWKVITKEFGLCSLGTGGITRGVSGGSKDTQVD